MRDTRAFHTFLNTGKKIIEKVYDPVIVSITIANYFTFVLGVGAYYSISNQVAGELGCGNFIEALSEKTPCGELQKIAILDSGGGWAEGGIFSTVLVVSAVMGMMIGLVRWAWCAWALAPAYGQGLELTLVSESQRQSLQETLSDELIQREDILQQREDQNWVQTIKTRSYRAWVFSRGLMFLALLLGLPKMFYVGKKILTEFGCEESFLKLVFWGANDSVKCNTIAIYYSMGSFSYPWAMLTWAGYLGWELAFTYQHVPEACRKIMWMPISFVSAFFSSPFQNVKVPIEKIFNYFHCLMPHISLWLKSLAILVLYPALYFVLKDGADFSNAVLKEYGCPSFFETIVAKKFFSSSLSCTPLTQILGIDAFPTKTELFDAYPIAAIVLWIALMCGSISGSILMATTNDQSALAQRIQAYHKMLDEPIYVGKCTSLLFLFPAAYALFAIAIPKANDLLNQDGCEKSYYPIFIYNLFDKNCSIVSRYRANAAFVSTMWIAFSYSGLLAGAAGMALSITGKVGISCVSHARRFFQRHKVPCQQAVLQTQDMYHPLSA